MFTANGKIKDAVPVAVISEAEVGSSCSFVVNMVYLLFVICFIYSLLCFLILPLLIMLLLLTLTVHPLSSQYSFDILCGPIITKELLWFCVHGNVDEIMSFIILEITISIKRIYFSQNSFFYYYNYTLST